MGVILHLPEDIHKYVKHEYIKLCKLGILLQDRFVSFPPLIYFFNHLFISIRNHRFFFDTLDYNPMLLYLVVQTVQALTTGSLFSWLLCLWGDTPIKAAFCFGLFSTSFYAKGKHKKSESAYFLTLQDAPGSSYIFPTTGLELDISQGTLIPFIGEWCLLENEDLGLGVGYYWDVIPSSLPSAERAGN